MILEKLELRNFRNYSKATFEFSNQTTIIVGPNTSGKTNILEAVSLLSRGSSMRKHKSQDLVRLGEEVGSLRGVFNGTTLEVILTSGFVQGALSQKKRLLVNGVPRRALDFVGLLKTAIFEPEDLELVHASPDRRRSFLDNVLLQVDREYRRAYLVYDRALRSRNRLLRRIKEERKDLDFSYFDDLLIQNGAVLTSARQKFINFLNNQPQRFGKFFVEYDKSIVTSDRLNTYHTPEREAGMTLVGPQRDDLLMFKDEKNKKPLAIFASRGEQRMGVLWLKMGELGYLANVSGERPLLLLDDVFSELDDEYIRRASDVMGGQQTIITTTHLEFVEKKHLNVANVIELGQP